MPTVGSNPTLSATRAPWTLRQLASRAILPPMRELPQLSAPVLVLAVMAGMALVAWALLAGSDWAMLAGSAGIVLGIKAAILLSRRAGVTDPPQ